VSVNRTACDARAPDEAEAAARARKTTTRNRIRIAIPSPAKTGRVTDPV
jgi:hypothetical protein